MKESSNLLFDLVLFGGTGDLAMRKLLPALYQLIPHPGQEGVTAYDGTAHRDDAGAGLKWGRAVKLVQ
ncbi:MAG: hypothetical protein SV765_15615, partial [Pseudomonadota bacterium]|nr:hypothetical protein [Pseudomonadota bacterium]